MEPIKRKIEDKTLNDIAQHIFNNALGNPIIFTTTPTLATMKANTWGVYSGTLYIRFADGTGISIAGVALS